MKHKEGEDAQFDLPGLNDPASELKIPAGGPTDKPSHFREIFEEASKVIPPEKKDMGDKDKSPYEEKDKEDHECPFCDTGYICTHKK